MTPRALLRRLGLVALILGPAGLVRAQSANVLPPARRTASVELANQVLARQLDTTLPENLNNPFYPDSRKPKAKPPSDTDTTPVPVAPSSDYELLGKIGPELTPSGTMILGGEPLLLFGQKKIRVGGELPILFEGKRYTLVITAIETSFFTIRLGEAEFTRPIKP